MPEATYEVRLSYREVDRPRLIQAMAVGADGLPLVGVTIRLRVDDAGSLEAEACVQVRDVVTGIGGTAYFRWWKWPAGGNWKDITSVITATWESEDVDVWLADLYE
jgi:hypothetical protein